MSDSTTAISDLPRDLVEEVISRVPLTSLRAVRTTCKKWNNLFKRRRFTKMHIRKSRAATKKRELMAIMMMESSFYLMSVNLRGIHNDDGVESFINRKGKLISLNDADGVDISSVSHCNGLLLCTTKGNNSRLVVLNPYRGQTRWIEPVAHGCECDRDMYSLGYEKMKNSIRCHKILRSMEMITRFMNSAGLWEERHCKYQIYNFNSDSWKEIHIYPDRHMRFYNRDVSLKGSTYWLVRRNNNWFLRLRHPHCYHRSQPPLRLGGPVRFRRRVRGTAEYFLICFDFTRERFGPPLSLPFQSRLGDCVTISSVREEKLAVLCQRYDTLQMEIWISKKIEPNAASWSKLFVALNMEKLLTFPYVDRRFFVDEGKKVVLVFEETKMRSVAYTVGEDGFISQVDLGKSIDKHCRRVFVCSYVPSSEQIKQATP